MSDFFLIRAHLSGDGLTAYAKDGTLSGGQEIHGTRLLRITGVVDLIK